MAKKVTLYTTRRCPVCNAAKRYLRQKGIAFVEFDVEKSRRGAKEFARFKARGVPVIVVGGEPLQGFDRRAFDELYYDD